MFLDTLQNSSLRMIGRLYSSRIAGSKLAFMDVVQDGCKVQVMCDFERLVPTGIQAHDFKDFCQLARRGDIICKLMHL